MKPELTQVSEDSQFIVYEPIKYPYLVTKPPSEINHPVDTPLTIPCSYDGNPDPIVTWLKSQYRGLTEVNVESVGLGTVERGERGFGGGDLVITKLTPEYEGEYFCEGTATVGGRFSATAEFYVIHESGCFFMDWHSRIDHSNSHHLATNCYDLWFRGDPRLIVYLLQARTKSNLFACMSITLFSNRNS